MGTTERVIAAEEHVAFDSAFRAGNSGAESVKGRQVDDPADMSPAARAALELIQLPAVPESSQTIQ